MYFGIKKGHSMRGFRIKKKQYILQEVTPGANILHVGCTSAPNTIDRWNTGALLHKSLCDKAKSCGAHVVGLDIDGESLAWLEERMPDVEFFHGDAEKLRDSLGGSGKFDLIIAGDVIEHLSSPGLFLESCRELLGPSGRVLITTCNAFGIGRFAKALLNHEAVHPEHTAYFSHRNLDRLCSMCGLKVLKSGYYKYQPMTKFSLNLLCTNMLEQVVSVIYPQFSEGVVVEAGPMLPSTDSNISTKHTTTRSSRSPVPI
jgi:2-polyprenyl-3-methyl-5-hydroxy-6-metoxy-1,4-benzoquinol methylase